MPSSKAVEAKLLFQAEDPTQARALFLEVHKECKERNDELGRHLTLYTHYWLSMLDSKFSQADYWATRAEKLGLSGTGLTRLPTPAVPKDEFDEELDRIAAEFEKEIAEKHP